MVKYDRRGAPSSSNGTNDAALRTPSPLALTANYYSKGGTISAERCSRFIAFRGKHAITSYSRGKLIITRRLWRDDKWPWLAVKSRNGFKREPVGERAAKVSNWTLASIPFGQFAESRPTYPFFNDQIEFCQLRAHHCSPNLPAGLSSYRF